MLNRLNAISPIDGRYRLKTKELSSYFSEEALIKYRILVEIEYFISLCEIPLPELKNFKPTLFEELRMIYKQFATENASEVKEIEKKTNHDVKSVEYFIKREFEKLGLDEFKEFIHFGLTSQDINNTAIPISIREAIKNVYIPHLDTILNELSAMELNFKETAILSHTHGQPASPTTLGKEIAVFSLRIKNQKKTLLTIPNAAKFSGATGNFNAHIVAYPNIDWKNFGKNFIEKKLKLHYSFPTTQIEHYDYLAALFDNLKRINTIFIDLNRDLWNYISMNYFTQKFDKNEVGSSTMPHKINPIDFENAEGNLGIANAVFEFLASKLPISRLQRDLTDSTVLRNIGVPFAHSIIAFQSTLKGLSKLSLNKEKIHKDLKDNWIVIAEGIQTILRREGYANPYEKLKEFTRNNAILNKKTLTNFIDSLTIDDKIKKELKKLTPFNYYGLKE